MAEEARERGVERLGLLEIATGVRPAGMRTSSEPAIAAVHLLATRPAASACPRRRRRSASARGSSRAAASNRGGSSARGSRRRSPRPSSPARAIARARPPPAASRRVVSPSSFGIISSATAGGPFVLHELQQPRAARDALRRVGLRSRVGEDQPLHVARGVAAAARTRRSRPSTTPPTTACLMCSASSRSMTSPA